MSKYRTVSTAAMLGTYEDFLELYKDGDEKIGNDTEDSILYYALRNTNDTARYKITNFLINKGADVKVITKDGMSLFFPLFSFGRQDIVKTTILCKTLLEKGADITVMHKKEKTVSFKMLFNIGTPEMEMLPLYQLIFSQPGLPLLVKDKWGLTVIEFARRSNRPIAVKMMEDYVKKYNLKEDS